ncbi:MAG: hypothetical protein HY688_02730 [Chloroflexi bacterium]|nr:hypothetical protein [Chloroflexota bacterium]
MIRRLALREWENYVPLSLIAAFGVLGLLYWFGLFRFQVLPDDVEKAWRAYVEIGIAATGAIFAIVITLSLVAIQFASQEYSHRIMAAYIKSVMFWAIIVVYIGLIAANMVAAANVGEANDARLVGLSFLGSILCLMLLLPHFLITAAYLKPDFVIGKLLTRIDIRYLTDLERLSQRYGGVPPTGADRLLPVVEMVERSIDKGDLTTTRTALDLIGEEYVRTAGGLHNSWADRYYLGHILRVGHKAVLSNDEESTAIHVVSLLGQMGALGPDTLAAEHIDDLGSLAFRRDADRVVDQVIDSLRQVFTATKEEETQKAILASYNELVARLSASDKERQTRHLTTVVYELAREALAQRANALALRFLEFLERIGRSSAAAKRHVLVMQTVEAVQALGVAAADDPDMAEHVVTALLRIERDVSASEREIRSATEYARGAIQYAVAQRRQAAATETPATLQVDDLWSTPAGETKPTSAPSSPEAVSVERGLDLDRLWNGVQDKSGGGPREAGDLWNTPGSRKEEEKKPTQAPAPPAQGVGDLGDLWGKQKE